MAKNKTVWVVGLFLLTSCLFFLPQTHAQVRGQKLYDLLSNRRKMSTLVKFDGIRSVWWAPDGVSYIAFEDSTFKRVDAASGEKTDYFDDTQIIEQYNLITGEDTQKLPFTEFSFVHENSKIQFTNKNRAFFYDLKSGELKAFLRERPIQGVRGHVYYEVYSNDLQNRAYTRDYNLYYKDTHDVEHVLTTGGHEDLRKGFPDWVYPEELDQYEAFWWSPNSDKIAYMQFDESPVFKYPIVHDIEPKPELEMESYPKAGENNPIIKFFIVDIKTGKTIEVDTGDLIDVYLMRGQWSSDGKEFYYQRLNRLQNKLELFAANPETGKSRLIFTETEDCYINLDYDMRFIRNGTQFLWTSEKSGFKEIYLYDISGKLVKQLTKHKLPVNEIVGVDEENGWVYFTGFENRGLESHLYRVQLNGKDFTRLTKEAGSHRIDLSPGGKFYTDSFSSFESPAQVAIYSGEGTLIRVIGETTVSDEFTALNLQKPEHVVFKAADGTTELDGMIYKPAHFDPNKKYPLIMSVYGGPGSRMIRDMYMMNSRSQTLAQLGFIVMSIDHRGVSQRGKAFETQMYMKLGQIEVDDHAQAVKWISQRPYVDSTRVGIYGHSYGGYLTVMALLKKPDVFHVGVSGAPVTDWRNYDTIYTERYMRRPKDNPDGYEKNSAMNFVDGLKGKLSIHHGAVDDNVHPGNSVQLLYALLKKNKKFDFMLYPEQRHGIRFPRYYEAIVEYFVEHLKPEVL
ncbi:MAG: S9 family peptidase [Deferribacteres bacterium]|nr:S9 family peptidase [candidate division KSB1 bacterium]MCB9500884.1 S9 family peptidase [Deferribacteres bacterium]